MKKLLILSIITLSSSSAFARLCNVEMVDNRTNRVIDTFLDRDDDCSEAMRECKTQIRLRGLTRGAADCHLRRITSRPRPRPNPRPEPNPYPYPQPGPDYSNDVRRPVYNGEEVIVNSRRVTVIGSNYYGDVSVRDEYGFVNSVSRDRVAITRGCYNDICVNERVISLNGGKEMTVAGLEYDGEYVLLDDYNFLNSNTDRNNIARTTGCLSLSYYTQMCVGNQAIDRYNRYVTITGIQNNGRVVVRDMYGFNNTNVDPRDLVITR